MNRVIYQLFDNFIDDKLKNILCNANEVENHLKELNPPSPKGTT